MIKGQPGTDPKAQCFTVNQTILAFQNQTGIKLSTLCLRYQKLYAWEMTNQAFELAIDELPDGTSCGSYSDAVTVLACYPGRMDYAKAAYLWPLTSRQQVKTAAEGATVAFRISMSSTAKLLVHLHLLWSSGQATLEIEESNFEVQRVHRDWQSDALSTSFDRLEVA